MASCDVLSENEVKQLTSSRLKTSNFKLKQYNFKSFLGEGKLGTYSILTTTVETSNTNTDISYFVKTLPVTTNEDDLNGALKAFEKEIFMYDLFDKIESEAAFIKCVVPTCYFTNGNTILVLHNLMSDGYRTLDKDVRDLETMLLTVKCFATYHAATIVYEEKMSLKLERKYRLIDDYKEEVKEMYYNITNDPDKVGVQSSIKSTKKAFETFQIGPSNNIENLFNLLYELIMPSTKIRNTLCHGDVGYPNVMLKADNCKLIDFQLPRYAPPTTDLLVIIYMSTSKGFRDQHMKTLFNEYYEQFQASLASEGIDASVFPIGPFLESCEEQKILGVLEAAMSFSTILLNKKDIKSMFEDDEVARQVSAEDTTVAFDYVELDKKEYYKRMKENLFEIKEMCDYKFMT